jgi:oxygen-independent coproporphyrinogen-3 oxidase
VDFYRIGINRLSIGIQSFNDQHLQALGRIHTAADAQQAIAIAKAAGFDNFNLDLMFGLPQQTLQQALEDIDTAIGFQPSHLSFYQLTLEPNTYFYRYPPVLPEDDDLYSMQQACQQQLAAYGYIQYEISAYAKHGQQARHNLNYWQFGDYLGIGAGAHGKLSLQLPDKILRTSKPKNPEQYLAGLPGNREPIATEQLPLEYVMNQLRLKAGFSRQHFRQMTGLAETALQPALADCLQSGLLTEEADQIRCSDRGWDFLDEILQRFYI